MVHLSSGALVWWCSDAGVQSHLESLEAGTVGELLEEHCVEDCHGLEEGV